jgi:hypothetical protein
MLSAGQFGKVAMGLSASVVGATILTGVDRRMETALVSASPAIPDPQFVGDAEVPDHEPAREDHRGERCTAASRVKLARSSSILAS